MFWIGLITGLFIGTNVGLFVLSLLIASQKGKLRLPTLRFGIQRSLDTLYISLPKVKTDRRGPSRSIC